MAYGPGCGGGGGPQLPHIPPQELEYYQTLFGYVDLENKGFVDRIAAAQFLLTSGLPQEVLRNVWEIADWDQQGLLGREGFFVACRLVAHAQQGRDPEPGLVAVEPPLLPDFQGVRRRRAPSEVSPPGSRPPSLCGAPSEISELLPVIAADEGKVRLAVDRARQEALASISSPIDSFSGVGPTATIPGARSSGWAPSRQDLQKYADLFRRTDAEQRGYIDGPLAKELLERSGLDVPTLTLAWDHADHDHDGLLGFAEFVVLVHLVTCVLKGLAMPSLREGLPWGLAECAAKLPPLEVLLAERANSGSRSPSASPAPVVASASNDWRAAQGWTHEATPDLASSSPCDFGGVMPPQGFDGLSAPSGSPALPTEGGFSDGNAFANPAGWGAAESGADMFGAADGFGSLGGCGEASGGFDEGAVKAKKKKKKKSLSENDMFGAFGGGGGFEDAFGVTFDAGAGAGFGAISGDHDAMDQSFPRAFDDAAMAPSSRSFNEEEQRMREEARQRTAINEIASTFQPLNGVDSEVARQLRRQVDELDVELRRLTEGHELTEREARREQREAQQYLERQRVLEAQLSGAQQRLRKLGDERRAANVESVSLRRDRAHVASELAFLRRAASDGSRTNQAIKRFNLLVEKACGDLEQHFEQLDEMRSHVLLEIQRERDCVREAQRENAELKLRLQRLRDQHAPQVGPLAHSHVGATPSPQDRYLDRVSPSSRIQTGVF